MKSKNKVLIAVVSIFLVGMIASFIYFLGYQGRFTTFLIQVNRSTIHAYDNDCLYLTDDRETYRISPDNDYKLYSWLIVAGPGTEKIFMPKVDEKVTLNYGDGGILILGRKDNDTIIAFSKDSYKHIFKSKDLHYDDFISLVLNKKINN